MSLPDNVIIFGRSGSGKGTQAHLLGEKISFEILDTGGLLRKMASEDGLLGQNLNKVLKEGRLVPSWVLFFVLVNFLRNFPKDKGLIFEGSPRKLNEAESMDEIFEWTGRSKTIAVLIDVSREESVRRLMNRRICSACGELFLYDKNTASSCLKCGGKLMKRSDDEPRAIEERLNFFDDDVLPVIDRYDKKGVLYRIDGERPIKEVFEDVRQAVEKYNKENN